MWKVKTRPVSPSRATFCVSSSRILTWPRNTSRANRGSSSAGSASAVSRSRAGGIRPPRSGSNRISADSRGSPAPVSMRQVASCVIAG